MEHGGFAYTETTRINTDFFNFEISENLCCFRVAEGAVFHLKMRRNRKFMETKSEELHEIPTPSQAEGSDEPGHQSLPKTTPSQAEGDEETIDENLKSKE